MNIKVAAFTVSEKSIDTYDRFLETMMLLMSSQGNTSAPEVIKLEYSFRLKIKTLI